MESARRLYRLERVAVFAYTRHRVHIHRATQCIDQIVVGNSGDSPAGIFDGQHCRGRVERGDLRLNELDPQRAKETPVLKRAYRLSGGNLMQADALLERWFGVDQGYRCPAFLLAKAFGDGEAGVSAAKNDDTLPHMR
ncbi:hypothetical protein D3C84_850980 [compost metagenome]